MLIRTLDGTGDWTFGRGKNDYSSGNAAIGQNIQSRLYSFLGDCYFALQDGIDWLNLFGSRNKRVAIELTVNGKLIESEGVTKVLQISSTVNSARHITLSYVVNTIYTGVSASDNIIANANFLLTQDGVILTTEDGDGITV